MKKDCLFLIFQLLSVYLFSQTPGTKKWEFLSNEKIFAGIMFPSPAIGIDGTIYVGSLDGNLYAINTDGKKKWEFLTGKSIQSSPAIGADGTIYVGSDDRNFYAVNPDGTEKWKLAWDGQVESSPAIGCDGTIYFENFGQLCAINPNGTIKWIFRTYCTAIVPPAIGNDGTIYTGDCSKFYAINPNGTQKWELKIAEYQGEISSSPAIGSDGTIYFGSWNNNLYAVNPNGNIKWKFKTGSQVQSAPVIGSDGTIYVGSDDKRLYAIDPNGTKKWEFDTGNNVLKLSPLIGENGIIYIGGIDKWSGDPVFYAVNPDGTKKWTFYLNSNIKSSAIKRDGTIYVVSERGIYALYSDSKGLADSPWPKFHKNYANTGNSLEFASRNSFIAEFLNSTQPMPFNLNFNCIYKKIEISNILFNSNQFKLNFSLPFTVDSIKNSFSIPLILSNPVNGILNTKYQVDYKIDDDLKTYSDTLTIATIINNNSELSVVGKRAIEAYNSSEDSSIVASLNNQGVIYRLLDYCQLAQNSFNLAVNQAINNLNGYSGIMMNQGVVKSDEILSDSANFFYSSAINDIQGTASTSVLAPQIYYNKAWEAYKKTEYTSASTLALQTINHTKANDYLKAKAYTLLGAIRYDEGKTNDAKDAFNQAVILDTDGSNGKMAKENLEEISSTDIYINTTNPDIRLYPNPSNGKIKISMGNLSGIFNVIVFNNAGEKVFSTQLNCSVYSSQNLDLSHLVDGMYFISITSQKLVFTDKIVIINK